MLNRQRGKRAQRKIAEKIEGMDIGILGGADVVNEKFIVEVKDRAKFSGEKFLQQIEKHKGTKHFKGRIPIAVIHIRGTRYENSIVLIRLKDFKGLVFKEDQP